MNYILDFNNKNFPDFRDVHTLAFDFDGIFTNNKVYIDQEGKESVRCDRADGLAFDLLRSFVRKKDWDLKFFIISKETNPVVIARAKKLKIDCHHSIDNKLIFLKNYLKTRFKENIDSSKGLIYLGNDLNDLASIRYSGFSVAPSDSHFSILKEADVILDQKGGEGFIRAFIEQLIFTDICEPQEAFTDKLFKLI